MVLPEGLEPSLYSFSNYRLYQGLGYGRINLVFQEGLEPVTVRVLRAPPLPLGYWNKMVRPARFELTLPVPQTGVLPGYTMA